MDITSLLGIVGAVLLVIAALYPTKIITTPATSLKNRLFALGSFMMLLYAGMWYLAGWSNVILLTEILIVMSCIFMLTNIRVRVATWIVALFGILFLIWSLWSFGWYDNILLFILGGIVLSIGYVAPMQSYQRWIGLTLWGILLVIFSYIWSSWIFFWLNIWFALGTGYCLLRLFLPPQHAQSHKK